MPGILDFDASRLDMLLSRHGLGKTWAGLLKANIVGKSQFEYILEGPFFTAAPKFSEDILKELTIGEIGILYEYSVAFLDPNQRKENGQFFTPDDVAMLMVKFAKSPKFDRTGIWLDPCSGIGNLSWHLCDSQDDPEKFLIHHLVLSDRDEIALEIARVLFTLSFQRKTKNLYERIKKNFVNFDFLAVSDTSSGILEEENSLSLIPKHDYVIVNPPYLATSRDERFETSQSSDLYAYFLENIIKTSRGFVSVTPQSFTNAAKFSSLRKLLLANFEHLTIYCFDNVPGNLFKGFKFGSKNTNTSNSIRAAITIATKGGKQVHRISSLIRWKSEDRARMLANVDKFLSNGRLSVEYFPKVNSSFEELYKELTESSLEKIGDLVSPNGHYSLYIPSSPRYFISALKEPVDRVSMRELHFSNKEKRDRAYLLLNSSVAYWWWRVRDGGMTLSLQTLLSSPVPMFNPEPALVKKLQNSEISSKVYKNNAGAPRENVKHSLDLILEINKKVKPDWADRLIKVHQNSEFDQLP